MPILIILGITKQEEAKTSNHTQCSALPTDKGLIIYG